jgi:ABC-type uncharacterized transport system substrate-binding protein
MRRRDFFKVVGGAAAWPIGTHAQPYRPRIGVLLTGVSPKSKAAQPAGQELEVDSFGAFRQGLSELGYQEGKNIQIEYRVAEGEVERFRDLAAELIQTRIDIIVAMNSVAGRAAQQLTRTIPIVVPVMGDPVGDGLVSSLSRPGGNVTGLTFLGPDLGPELLPKRFGLLKEALPAISHVAVLWHVGAYGERTMENMINQTEAVAKSG